MGNTRMPLLSFNIDTALPPILHSAFILLQFPTTQQPNHLTFISYYDFITSISWQMFSLFCSIPALYIQNQSRRWAGNILSVKTGNNRTGRVSRKRVCGRDMEYCPQFRTWVRGWDRFACWPNGAAVSNFQILHRKKLLTSAQLGSYLRER